MSNWTKGSTRAWRKTRALVLRRDGHVCQVQLNGCLGAADCVHHVKGRGRTGDDPAYLIASCTPCNSRVGDPSINDPQPRRMTRW